MKYESDSEAWVNIPTNKLWVFDKLLLSKYLGYVCGPTGVNVPKPGTYIVRPCMNLLGMGIGARFVELTDTTDHLEPGSFWCEVFKGRHISVDYYKGDQILAVEGKRDSESPLWKFKKWIKLDDKIEFPHKFFDLFDVSDYINVEYVNGKVIELHFRTNQDFRYGNTIAIPVWSDDELNIPMGYTYVDDPDFKRKGFYIK